MNYEDLKKIAEELTNLVKEGADADKVATDFENNNLNLRVIRFNDYLNNFSHFSIF